MPTLTITSKDLENLESLKAKYEELNTADHLKEDVVEDIKKRAGVNTLMRMAAVNSVNRNLKQEDDEMSDWYNRMNDLLGKSSTKNGELNSELNPGKGTEMMVAGDVNITEVSKEKEEEKIEIAPNVPAIVSPNTMVQNLTASAISAMVGAGLLASGIVIGNGGEEQIKQEPTKPPPVSAPIVDTDTIGILEPDKD